MGQGRLTAGLVMASVGSAIFVLSVILGLLLSVSTDTGVVMDEGDLSEMDSNEYAGQIYHDTLSSVSRARVLSRTEIEFNFTLIIRDPDGWVVKNHTDSTPFNRNLELSSTLIGYYEVRLRILTPGVEKDDIRFEILGTSSNPLLASTCSLFMMIGMGGGLLMLFGVVLVISHFFGMYEDEDRLKVQPASTPVDVPGPPPGTVQSVPEGVTLPPLHGMSRYQHARELEAGGRYAEAYHIYRDLDLPVDAARCQSLYDASR
ncbi:MAG: hypothetical protein ACMUHU_05070 [Thermoplasmatota archaeon]